MGKELINQCRDYVSQHYQPELEYHNIIHAERVMSAATDLAKTEGLSKSDIEKIKIACLFHDIAYEFHPDEHEVQSAQMASEFLIEQGLPPEEISAIEALILATHLGTQPKNISEMIMKDADLSHLGSLDFSIIGDQLRAEKERRSGKKIPDQEWLKINIDFLTKHRYFTDAANKKFGAQKMANLKNLLKPQKQREKELKKSVPDRGIETMFRVTLRNNNSLSQIADNKANIMLSVTTIMLSLILSTLLPKLDSNSNLVVPTIITIIVCLVTMYFAVLATRPKIVSSNYSRQNLLDNKLNILFFGNFHDISLDEFEWGVDRLMEDKDLLYGALKKDIYFLGIVLSKKYKFLRNSYNVFMVGLTIAGLSYIMVLFP